MTPKQVADWVKKYGTNYDKERYRVLFREIETLKKEISYLKKVIAEAAQPEIFKNVERETRITELSKKVLNEVSPLNWQAEPLSKRLYDLRDKKDSNEFKSILKWNRLTLEMALKLIENYERDLTG